MKKVILGLIFFLTAFLDVLAQPPGMGIYPATVVPNAGGNALVIPATLPINAISMTAYAGSNFQGLLHVSPTTGMISITNAHPAGTYNISVNAFNGLLSATTSFTLTVNNTVCSQGLFSGNGSVGVGALPFSVAIGDFNSDGKQDIVTTSYGFNAVSIRLGDGLGAFSGGFDIPVEIGPQSVAIGDFNSDGKQDIAVANFVSSSISVLFGNGAGNFSVPVHIPLTAGSFTYSVAVGDFNNDGKQDLVAPNYGNNTVSLILGNGTGGFTVAADVSVGNGPKSLTVGDFNADGNQDIATANYLSNSISIRLGNGLGGFSGIGSNAVGNNPHSITIADFNGDGKQDIVTANITNSSASIRLGDGMGNFSGTTEVNVGNDPRSVAVGDFNGDGRQDIATANYSTNSISVRIGDGNGNFSGNVALPVANSPFSVVVGDFNGDGKQDIVAANAGSSEVSIRLGNVNAIQVQGNNITIADGDTVAAPEDHTDFGNVTNNLIRNFTIQNPGAVTLKINSITLSGTDANLFTVGTTVFPVSIAGGTSYTFQLTFIPTSIGLKTAAVQIMNDNCDKGNYDFAVQGTGVALVSTLGNYPPGSSIAGGNITVTPDAFPSNVENITAYTSVGFRGLLLADPVSGAVTITNAHPEGIYTVTVKANGVSSVISSFILTVSSTSCSQGLFTLAGTLPVGVGAQSAVIGDFNRDGIQDIAIANNNTGISIRLGNATGIFTGTTEIPVGSNPRAIAVGDFNGDGKQDMAVANNNSNDVSIRLGDGLGGFAGSAAVLAGTNPSSIVAGDFNGDGKQDLAIANHGSNNVSILSGDGLAGFIGTATIPVGSGPLAISIADFNNDGKHDLVTANSSSNSVSIFLNDGFGAFVAAPDFPVGINPNSIVVSDFDGNGNQDIATTNSTSNNISIRFGDGAGNFSMIPEINTGTAPGSLMIGDFNGDGKQDLVTANYYSNNISIRFGNGTGGFGGLLNMPTGIGPVSLVVGDFNADGKQDIISVNAISSDVSVHQASMNDINVQGNSTAIADGDNVAATEDHTDFGNVTSNLTRTFTILNTGAVNLVVNQIVLTGADAALFTVGNIGLPVSIGSGGSVTFTIAFVPTSAGLKTATVNILNNNCDKASYDFAVQGTGVVLVPVLGVYPAATVNTAGGNITVMPDAFPANSQNIIAYTTSNFKGIMQVDIATGAVIITNAHPAGSYLITVKAYGISTTSGSFLLTVNNTGCSQGAFAPAANVAVGNNPFSLAVGDFNGDGRQDIATADYSANTVSIRLGNGFGSFSGMADVGVGNQPFSVAIGDFNGDGKQDLATANHSSNNVSIRLGDGLGNFTGNTEVPVGNQPTQVVIGDLNSDGKQDIAVAILGSNSVSVRLGDGTGNFSGNISVTGISALFSVAIGDFNADGNRDLAMANYNINTVSIYSGDGLGGFSLIGDVTVGINPYSVAIGDFNADGKQDLATANYYNNSVSVCLGNGTGGFALTSDVPVGAGPGSLAIGDFNGDGKQDIATANYLGNTISVRLGDGTGNFAGTTNMIVGIGPEVLAIGDFNGDGKQDIATCNNGNNNISVRLGIAADINIQGNNISIANGDTTTTANDFTDFGIGNNVTRSFNIQNKGNANLFVGNIFMSGTHASLFTVGNITLPLVIPAGGSASFTIDFQPITAGVKTATVNIGNDDCDEAAYNFSVQGMFECPQVLVNFTGLANAFCINASAVTLTGNFTQGAVFTGAGINDNGNGTAIFDPALAGEGLHIIYYIYTDTYGCTNIFSQAVTIHPLPVVSFSGLAANYFISDASVTLTGNPMPNGIFTGPGITGTGNGMAIFDPASAGAGTHDITYFFTDINGCSSTVTQQVTVTNAITLNLKLFLQGYYTGNGSMQPVLNNHAVPFSLANETDTITVELHDPGTFALVDVKQAVLLTDGLVSVTFMQPGGAYYIAIRHRNTLYTWSAVPVSPASATQLYDFSTDAGKAFANNQIEVEPGIWALFTGDINQDEFIDGNDFPEFDTDSFNGISFEYKATDMNGDGFVDGNDFPVFDLNSFNGVSAIYP